MPAWLVPALKAVLPHVGTIISTAVPVFTRKSADAATNQAALLQQQITELQAAASLNATHIRELAAQMQTTVAALEEGAVIADKKLERISMLCFAALGLSAVSLCGTMWILIAR